MCRVILLRIATPDTGRNLFLPTDRSLCCIDIHHVLGIFPDDSNHVVLRCTTIIEKYQTNDGKGTVTLFPIVLASRWTTFVDCNLDIDLYTKSNKIHELLFSLQSLWIFSLINYKPPTFHNGTYSYPGWAHGLGWSLTAASLVCIPAYALVMILRSEGNTFLEVSK